MYRFKVAGNLSSLVSLSLNKRREPGGSEGRNPYDAGEGALSRRERSGDAMGEGAPSMSLGSSPATPTRNRAQPHLRPLLRPRPKNHKTPLQTSPTPEIQSKPPGVDGAGDENGIFRGLVVEENVDSISSTGPPSLSRKLSTELQICDSELPPSKIGFYTEFTPVMKIIIFKLFCASLPSSKNRRGS